MEKDRVILHVDMNNFYASVECLYDPALKYVPMAVGGDPESRHGIVLAKNMLAKRTGVKTAEALWEAKRKCPGLVIVKPHGERYLKYSQAAVNIYMQYTDQVESFGPDECWLDVTGSTKLFGSGRNIAEEIRQRIKEELGLTVSVGVSFNKIFAKLGSDYKKPDAVTEFTRGNYRELIWPLDCGELLYAGPSTQRTLRKFGYNSIGDIALAGREQMKRILGKSGETLWAFAMGLDSSPVSDKEEHREIKSIGNSTTTPKDLVTDKEIKVTLYVLAESVARRLRDKGLMATGLQISERSSELEVRQHQCVLDFPVSDSDSIFKKAFELFMEHRPNKALRSIGIRAIKLTPEEGWQFSLYKDEMQSRRRSMLEHTVDSIRDRYGRNSLVRASAFSDRQLSAVDPRREHVIHPVGFFK